jgi:uncharacterized protein YcbK (DUF882 family)
MNKLIITTDTRLKPGTNDSTEYKEADIKSVTAGTKIPIAAYRFDRETQHIKFTLDVHNVFTSDEKLREFHPSLRNTWWAFGPHTKDPEGYSQDNKPNDKPISHIGKGFKFELPGYVGSYYSGDPIHWENKFGTKGNFTWAEALHFNSSGDYRKPNSTAVVNRIKGIAQVMEEIRARYDKPIIINSWYRDPVTNAAVGGASQSRHMIGDAVDFVVPGVACHLVFRDLDRWWGNRGGLASSSVFTHIDMRGYRARWDYGY